MINKIIYLAVFCFFIQSAYSQIVENVSSEIYEVKTFNHNSELSDFAPTFYLKDLVFSSNRFGDDNEKLSVEGQGQPFFDLLYFSKKTNKIISFSKRINSKYHESTAVFTKDGTTVYFTRNNYTKRLLRADSTDVNRLKLYKGELNTKGKWLISELPFNSNEYSMAHPALSPDESILYFASDMPGSAGASDIYKVTIETEGYGEVMRLDTDVNTIARETFPFIDELGNLYFSSDRQGGYGNLDIYKAVQSKNSYVVSNLGMPINSVSDDISFIIDAKGDGYFSSNREGGQGEDDIYVFSKVNAPAPETSCILKSEGTIVNMINKEILMGVDVVLKNINGDILESTKTNDKGNFNFSTSLNCNMSYTVIAKKLEYKEVVKTFVVSKENERELRLDLKLKPIIDLIYRENGLKKFKIKNLNFDLNKDDIRPDARIELDKIVKIMIAYPSISIKIESHTDSRGSDLYNKSLSQRRADSTRNYLLSRGINSNRLESAIGYGESRLVNSCSNDVKCSNEKHDLNRRSEFIITKM